jgi:hypothetical protein
LDGWLRAGKREGNWGNEKLSVNTLQQKKGFSSHATENHLPLRISLWISPSLNLKIPLSFQCESTE